MRQADGMRAWWAELDPVDRRRVLRLADDDLLAEDLAAGLMMHGVTVIALDASPVDGGPVGYVIPDLVFALLDEVRGAP